MLPRIRQISTRGTPALVVPAIILLPLMVALVRTGEPALLLLLFGLFVTLTPVAGFLLGALGRTGLAAATVSFAVLLAPGIISAAGVGYYLFYSALTCLLFWPLACLPGRSVIVRGLTAATILAVVSLGLLCAGYASTSGSLPNRTTWYAVYQTDGSEAFHYLRTFIEPSIMIGAILVLALILVLLGRMRTPTTAPPRPLLSLMVLLAAAAVAWATAPGTSNELRLISSAMSYGAMMREYRAVAATRKTSDQAVDARLQRPDDELHVIVIGESTNRNHMQLYGYARPTTPRLSRLRDDLFVFTDTIAYHSHTPGALRMALTLADADNGLDYVDPGAYSLLEILRAAGVETYWLSNQNRVGAWDNQVAVLAEGADHVEFVSRRVGRDLIGGSDRHLLPVVREILQSKPRSAVMFVHLMGTHWPYRTRYPKRHARFTGPLQRSMVGERILDAEAAERVNAYDNAVLYNDFIVGSLLEQLQRHGPAVSSLIYFADHGESVFDGSGHDAERFARGHVEVPLLLWFSDGFEARHPALVQSLERNRHKRFMLDEFEDLALDVVGVETPALGAARSPARDDFSEPRPRRLQTGVVYDRHDDPILAARRNLRRLREKRPDLVPKVWAHRVNSLGKLAETAPMFAGVEIDLVYDEIAGRFEVRHPPVEPIGLVLHDVLSMLERTAAGTRLWLDLKNVGEDNIRAIETRLRELDARFDIKQRAIIETSYTGAGVEGLARAGFYVSYYLPTRKIRQAMKADDTAALEAMAAAVAAVVERHQARAISFDASLRPFVEGHLERVSRERGLDHLTWDLSIDASSPDFLKRVARISRDGRTKVVLVRLRSEFDI